MSEGDSVVKVEQPMLLVDHLLAAKPSQLLLIGCSSADLYLPENKHKLQAVSRFDTLSEATHFLKSDHSSDSSDNIAVFNVTSCKDRLEQALGAAVRAFPNRLIVYTQESKASDALFFAFGFRKLDVLDGDTPNTQHRWYEFRLSHYKQPPDWLNSKFWANPMRFDLHDELSDDADYVDEEE